MKWPLLLLLVILIAGCIDGGPVDTPLQEIAAESPPAVETFAYINLQALATNQELLNSVMGIAGQDTEIPAFVGNLLIVAPEARIIMYDGATAAGITTFGGDAAVNTALPLLGGEGFEQKEYLGIIYYSSDSISIMGNSGRVYVGEEKVLKAILNARSGANAVLSYSGLLNKLPAGDIMFISSSLGELGTIGMSLNLLGELAKGTIVIDAGSLDNTATTVMMASMLGSVNGIFVEGTPEVSGQYVSVKIRMDISQINSIEDMFKLQPTMPAGGIPGGETTPITDLTEGPGGCLTETECEEYCNDHMADCINWAAEHGLLTSENLDMYGM